MNSVISKLIVQRAALGCLLLFAVSILIFVGTQILPGDVAQSILGQSATPLALANLREELGLNDPAYVRYFEWLFGMLQGDLGTSLSSRQDIAGALSGRLQNTLFLATCAAVIAVPLSLIFGMIAVLYRGTWVDKSISGFGLATTSLPEFFIGYLLIFFFAVKLRAFPAISTIYNGMPLPDKLHAVALPALALTLVVFCHMMRMTRAAILSIMQSAYIETAELKGVSAFSIIWKHAFPNAISPVVNVVMLNLAYLIVGVVVIEVIFVYPGLGQYLVDHVAKRDVPVVQAVGLIFAAAYISLNTLADIISIISNPRLRHPK